MLTYFNCVAFTNTKTLGTFGKGISFSKHNNQLLNSIEVKISNFLPV